MVALALVMVVGHACMRACAAPVWVSQPPCLAIATQPGARRAECERPGGARPPLATSMDHELASSCMAAPGPQARAFSSLPACAALVAHLQHARARAPPTPPPTPSPNPVLGGASVAASASRRQRRGYPSAAASRLPLLGRTTHTMHVHPAPPPKHTSHPPPARRRLRCGQPWQPQGRPGHVRDRHRVRAAARRAVRGHPGAGAAHQAGGHCVLLHVCHWHRVGHGRLHPAHRCVHVGKGGIGACMGGRGACARGWQGGGRGEARKGGEGKAGGGGEEWEGPGDGEGGRTRWGGGRRCEGKGKGRRVHWPAGWRGL